MPLIGETERPKRLTLWGLWRGVFSGEMWALLDHSLDCKRCKRCMWRFRAEGYCRTGQPLADRVRGRYGV